jgi:hypothetical protein
VFTCFFDVVQYFDDPSFATTVLCTMFDTLVVCGDVPDPVNTVSVVVDYQYVMFLGL